MLLRPILIIPDSPHDMAQLLYAACQCACLVYKPDAQPGPELIPVMSRTASVTGTTKAVSMWKLECRKTLIVSIRGTASAADHMVNMNAEPDDASKALVSAPHHIASFTC